jgi:hypothetical protein
MKLTRGEFCQFNLNTRLKLLKEFGINILEKKIRKRSVSVYKIYGFYVEVYVNLANRKLEKVEPLKNIRVLDFYNNTDV